MTRMFLLSLTALLALTACAKKQVAVAEPPPPVAAPVVPQAPPGAVLGSTAADRDGGPCQWRNHFALSACRGTSRQLDTVRGIVDHGHAKGFHDRNTTKIIDQSTVSK